MTQILMEPEGSQQVATFRRPNDDEWSHFPGLILYFDL